MSKRPKSKEILESGSESSEQEEEVEVRNVVAVKMCFKAKSVARGALNKMSALSHEIIPKKQRTIIEILRRMLMLFVDKFRIVLLENLV